MREQFANYVSNQIYNGGVMSLDAFIENMKEVKKKIGDDKTLTIGEFIDLVVTFKEEYYLGIYKLKQTCIQHY